MSARDVYARDELCIMSHDYNEALVAPSLTFNKIAKERNIIQINVIAPVTDDI